MKNIKTIPNTSIFVLGAAVKVDLRNGKTVTGNVDRINKLLDQVEILDSSGVRHRIYPNEVIKIKYGAVA